MFHVHICRSRADVSSQIGFWLFQNTLPLDNQHIITVGNKVVQSLHLADEETKE
jgi:hypothetical protein